MAKLLVLPIVCPLSFYKTWQRVLSSCNLLVPTSLSPFPALALTSLLLILWTLVWRCALLPYPTTPPHHHHPTHPCKKPGRKGCLVCRLAQHDGDCYGEKGAVVRQHRPSPAWCPPPTESCLWVVLLAGEAEVEGRRWTMVVGFQKVAMMRFL